MATQKIDFEKYEEYAQDLGVTLPDHAGLIDAVYNKAVRNAVYAAMVAKSGGVETITYFRKLSLSPADFDKKVVEFAKAKKKPKKAANAPVVKAKKPAKAGSGRGVLYAAVPYLMVIMIMLFTIAVVVTVMTIVVLPAVLPPVTSPSLTEQQPAAVPVPINTPIVVPPTVDEVQATVPVVETGQEAQQASAAQTRVDTVIPVPDWKRPINFGTILDAPELIAQLAFVGPSTPIDSLGWTAEEESLVVGDCSVDGYPVYRSVQNEGEVTLVREGDTVICVWGGEAIGVNEISATALILREFIQGCNTPQGCNTVAWHYTASDAVIFAKSTWLAQLSHDSCDKWSQGHVAPSGLVCVVATDGTATTGSDVLISWDGRVTWEEILGFGKRSHEPVTFHGPMAVYCPYGCSFEPGEGQQAMAAAAEESQAAATESPPPPTPTATASSTGGHPNCSGFQSQVAPVNTICYVDVPLKTGADVFTSTDGETWEKIPNFGIANHPPEPVPYKGLVECPYGCSFNTQ